MDFRALTKSTVYTTKVHFQDNSNIFPAVYLVLLAESNIEVIHGKPRKASLRTEVTN